MNNIFVFHKVNGKLMFYFQFFIIFFFVNCKENNVNLNKGVIWELSDGNGNINYLFGTIHLYLKGEIKMDSLVIEKLIISDYLILERNILENSENNLSSKIGNPDLFKDYNIMRKEYGNELESMESILITVAKRYGINFGGLETTSELIKTLRNLDIKEDVSDKEIVNFYNSILHLYQKHDNDEIAKKLSERFGSNVKRKLVDNRNEIWVKRIDSLFKNKKTNFIAVGVGHLGGQNGLLNLLRNKKYSVISLEIR